MAMYLKGSVGDCVDCSNDDPCSEGECVTLRDPGFSGVSRECRLRDIDYSGDQLHVANSGFYHAIKWDGVKYTRGDTFNQSHVSSKMTRTSHSGSTFAVMDLSDNIYLYSVDSSTLEITNTAGPIAAGMTGTLMDICFLDDDDILLVSIDTSGATDNYHFAKGVVTGGGTGMTISSSIIDYYASGSYGTDVVIEKVEDGKAVAIIVTSVSNTYARFIDGTGASPTLGTNSILGSSSAFKTSGHADEASTGCVSVSGDGGMRYFEYSSVGAKINKASTSIPAMTSTAFANYGILLERTSKQLTPFTISSFTITLGTPVSDTEITATSRIRGSDGSTAILYKLQDGKAKGCIVT